MHTLWIFENEIHVSAILMKVTNYRASQNISVYYHLIRIPNSHPPDLTKELYSCTLCTTNGPEVILLRLQPWILNIFGYCMWYKLSCFWKHFFGNRYLSVNVCSLIILWCWLCFLHSDSLNALLACATKMIDRRVSFRTNNKHQQLTQTIVFTAW